MRRALRFIIAVTFVWMLVLLVCMRDEPDAPTFEWSLGMLGGLALLYFAPLEWPKPTLLPRARARFGKTRTS